MAEQQTTDDELHNRAKAITALANAEAAKAPWMAQRAALEGAAERLCGTKWDWLVVEEIGAPPTLLITGYRGSL
jgi:hypothetical protein